MALASEFQSGEPVHTESLKPMHGLRTGSDGGRNFRGELWLFSRLPIIVNFTGAWPREEVVLLEHEFNAQERTNRVVT